MNTKILDIRPDITIRYNRTDYNYDNLSQAVSYWLNIVQNCQDGPIGIAYSGLSFSAVALLLALLLSGRNYRHMGVYSKRLKDNTNIHKDLDIDTIFILGTTEDELDFVQVSKTYIRTDCWHHAWQCARWPGREKLSIPFRDSQQISAYTSGTTGSPSHTKMNSYTESISIETAMNYYFREDDYCVFFHGMSHAGVHTTAILPAIFKANTISFCETNTWDEEISKATHTQYFYTMMTAGFAVPKKVRVITTGGDILKEPFFNHIRTQCDYKHFYDIYGLTEALPPLAIRDIQNINDLTKPFTWISPGYDFSIDPKGHIVISRPTGDQLVTNDIGNKSNNELTFVGRKISYIRLNDFLLTVKEFKEKFEQATGIVSYVIEFIQTENSCTLHALKTDQTTIEKFIIDNRVEIIVEYYNELDTNGGIKNIR